MSAKSRLVSSLLALSTVVLAELGNLVSNWVTDALGGILPAGWKAIAPLLLGVVILAAFAVSAGSSWLQQGMTERDPRKRSRTRQQMAPEVLASFWQRWIPGQIPTDLVAADPLPQRVFQLEGHDLVAVDLGHTDTDDTTCLYVPEIGLVVAGDAAYNDVHLYLVESSPTSRRDWLAALDTVESLRPTTVIAGHKRAGRADVPAIIEETRQYIRDFDRLVETTSTALELYEQMLALYPDRVNPGALWASARTLKPSARQASS